MKIYFFSNSPYLNHFTQPDSIIPDYTNPQSWNRYAYALNNPVNFTDPSGHDPWWNDPDFYYSETFVNAGLYQQNGGWGHGYYVTGHPRKAVDVLSFLGIIDDPESRSIGPGKFSDKQMATDYGEPVSGDPKHSSGYGLSLSGLDQSDYDVAKIAMGRRIGSRLEACVLAGCSATDRVIVAALAANEDITPDEIIRIFKKDAYWKYDTFGNEYFDWDKYFDTDRGDKAPRMRDTIIPQFLDGIDSDYKDSHPEINWE